MVESVAEMAGKRKSFTSPNSAGKPQKKVKTEQGTPNNAKGKKNTPKKTTPQIKGNEQQAKKNMNTSVSQNANKDSEQNTSVRKTFSKRKFRDFVKDAATGEVKPEVALIKIQEQINKIQTNDDLSNTAKRKLSKLYSIADTIQKRSGINKIDISKGKSLKPVAKILPKVKNEKPELLETKPIKKEVDADKNVVSEEEESEENSEGDDSEDGEEEEEDSEEGEDDSEEDEEVSLEGAEEESGENEEDDEEEDEDDDDDDADNNKEEKKEQTVKVKTNEKKKVDVQSDKKEEVDNFTVFVGNLPFETTDDEVKEHFSKTGGVISVNIPKQRKLNRSKGFAIINLKDKESYDKALAFHFTHLNGRQIYVRQYFQTPKNSSKQDEPHTKSKQFGNQGKPNFSSHSRGSNRGGFNSQNRRPMQRGGFNPQNRRPMQRGGFKPKRGN